MSFEHDSHTLQENNQMYAHHIAGEGASPGLRRDIPSCLVGGHLSSLYQGPPPNPRRSLLFPVGKGQGHYFPAEQIINTRERGRR